MLLTLPRILQLEGRGERERIIARQGVGEMSTPVEGAHQVPEEVDDINPSWKKTRIVVRKGGRNDEEHDDSRTLRPKGRGEALNRVYEYSFPRKGGRHRHSHYHYFERRPKR